MVKEKTKINYKNYFILIQYIKQVTKQCLTIDPNLDKDKLIEIILEMINERFVDTNCVIYNNYKTDNCFVPNSNINIDFNHMNDSEVNNVAEINGKNTTLAGVINIWKKNNFITTEQGVMFYRHSQLSNPNFDMITMLIDERSKAKGDMFKAQEKMNEFEIGSEEYNKYYEEMEYWDIIQKVFKVLVNSWYGASGQRQSAFFNLHAAASVTGKGQSIISCALTTFERFMANNIKFKNSTECFSFINSIKDEEYNILDRINIVKSKKEVYYYLLSRFFNPNVAKKNQKYIKQIVMNLDENTLNKIYYKNNLYEYLLNKKPSSILSRIFKNCNDFLDPNSCPDSIKDDLELLWSWLKTDVRQLDIVPDKIERLKRDKRKIVTTVDTDSNFINLNSWVRFNQDKFELDKDDDTRYTIVNVAAYFLTKLIKDSYQVYTKNCNVEEEPRKFIKMKNEFLFKVLLLTENKKSYASILELREGHKLNPSKLDIKGLDIKKANFNNFIGEDLQKILENDILRKEVIDNSVIIRHLSELSDKIRISLSKGETKYTSPDKINNAESYKLPFQMGVVRGMLLYNSLNIGEEITMPSEVNTVKLKWNQDIMVKLKKESPDVYDEIMNLLYTNVRDNKILMKYFSKRKTELEEMCVATKDNATNTIYPNPLTKYGISILSLPKSIEKIPDYFIPLIDVDSMVNDAMKKSLVFLKCIGIEPIEVTEDEKFFSNIINF